MNLEDYFDMLRNMANPKPTQPDITEDAESDDANQDDWRSSSRR